jgi:LMBR1 domain-containing protein 1
VRPTFPVYVMALGAVAGWFLFIVFAGVGVVALPVDLIKAFIYRPRSILPKSEFLKQAREISVRSKVSLARIAPRLCCLSLRVCSE